MFKLLPPQLHAFFGIFMGVKRPLEAYLEPLRTRLTGSWGAEVPHGRVSPVGFQHAPFGPDISIQYGVGRSIAPAGGLAMRQCERALSLGPAVTGGWGFGVAT